MSRLAQAELYNYDLTEENGWLPDFDALEKLPLEKIKLMWINYPHMPTGTPATMELFEKIVAFGKKHSIVIAHDNPYSFILNDKPLSLLQVDGAKDIAIEMNSMSKSHNMAGWRIGMLASNPRFINWILKVKSNIDSGQFKPIMLAAAKGLPPERNGTTRLTAFMRHAVKSPRKLWKHSGVLSIRRRKDCFSGVAYPTVANQARLLPTRCYTMRRCS